jgi:hypothetical protein
MGLVDVLDAQGSGAGDLEGYVSGGAPRDRACGRSGGSESGELSRCARNESVFASKAPSGSVPLPLRVAGSVWRKRRISGEERIMPGGSDLGRNNFLLDRWRSDRQ